MGRKARWLIFLICTTALILFFSLVLPAQEPVFKPRIKPGFALEYFSRTINWDESNYHSKLRSLLYELSLEYEIQDGFSLGAILGYSTTTYKNMVFRHLPFSVEIEGGGIGGYLFGGQIHKKFFKVSDYEITASGQFVLYSGINKEWDLPGLNVEGKLKGKPIWYQVEVGPAISYQGFDYFTPYFAINFNRLWGNFEMNETVLTLKGREEKKITGNNFIEIAMGVFYELTDSFLIKGEARSFLPSKDGIDFGLRFQAVYKF